MYKYSSNPALAYSFDKYGDVGTHRRNEERDQGGPGPPNHVKTRGPDQGLGSIPVFKN